MMPFISSNLRRFFVVTNAAAIGIAILAAAVNLVVGPFNAAMWLVPVAIVLFAAITLVIFDAAVRQAEDPDVVPWMVRRLFGKRVAYLLRVAIRWHTCFVSRCFLTAVPLFSILLATILLVFSITGRINGGG